MAEEFLERTRLQVQANPPPRQHEYDVIITIWKQKVQAREADTSTLGYSGFKISLIRILWI